MIPANQWVVEPCEEIGEPVFLIDCTREIPIGGALFADPCT